MSSEAAQKAGGGVMSTRDELAAWTTRDELIADLSAKVPAAEWDMAIELGDVSGMADALIAEGWRKKPSESEVIAVLDDDMNWDVGELSPVLLMEQTARAILALMDRGQ